MSLQIKDIMKTKTLIIISLLLFIVPAYSQTFLDLYPDAFSSALNGAGDTIIRNSYAVYNNPANLIFLFQDEATFSYMVLIDGIQRGTASYAWKTRSFLPIAVDLSYLSYGSIQQFTLGETEYSVIEGGEANLWYLSSGISSSRRVYFLNNYFLLGAKLDLLVNHLDKSYSGVLLHTGVIYYPDFKGLVFSLVLNNIGLLNSFEDTAPLKTKVGIGYKTGSLETELNYNFGKNELLKWGNSLKVTSFFKALLGVKFDKNESMQNNINLGAELNFPKITVNYTIIPKSHLGYYHYISVKREM